MKKKNNTLFIAGAIGGTALGMLLFAHVGQFLIVTSQIQISPYLNTIFTLLFLVLTLVQTVKCILKNNLSLRKIAKRFGK